MTIAYLDSATELDSPFEAHDSLRTVRIGLAGCGVVGGALVRLLHDSRESVASRHGIRFVVSSVLVRDVDKPRHVPLTSNVFTDDADSFNAESVDVVVEAIGGETAASDIARSAISRGLKFVTANKQLIAAFGPELNALARQESVTLDFGAAVGGSAPVISLVRDLTGTATPSSVRGILNGTTNYILTLVESGLSFADALSAARREGLAEADCSRDLDGRDAAAKLAIIGWLSYGIAPGDLNVHRVPLTDQASRLVHHAADLEGKLRIICECVTLRGNRVTAAVEPVIVPGYSAFARTEHEDNRVEVDLGWSAPLAVSGPGAGGHPTATALLSDLLHSPARATHGERHAAPFISVEDPRDYSWLVIADGDSHAAVTEIERVIGTAARVESSGNDHRILFSASRSTLGETLRSLHALGIESSAARIARPDVERRIQ